MIKIDDLGFAYGQKPVLRHITTNLEPGHVYGLLGENGVGKTTLLTLLCGLKKPQEGTISLIDGDVADQPYNRKPSYLQSQYYLPDEVAGYNMKASQFAESRGKFWPKFDMDKFTSIIADFETDPEQKMSSMSAGQLKKVYISFALATNASYIFMDEPTNGLDIPSKAQFRKAILYKTSEDAVVVISTHQVKDLENIIDPIIILDKQEVLLNASLDEISSKLYFDYGQTLNIDSLYTEQLPGGFIQVYPNATGEESKVNIEALFNTAYKHKDLVRNLFKHE